MADDSDASCPSQQDPNAWVRTELESVDTGDKRLNRRLLTVMEKFWAKPESSIPKSMGSWATTKAAYRFINNPKVTPERILVPHKEATQSRIKEHAVVLAVQDTTELNFTAHPATKGLGTMGSTPDLRGMFVHSTLAFTPERVPLGIIDQHTWVRPVEEFGKKISRKNRAIEEKESAKWLDSLKATEALQQHVPDVLLVNVGDREADVFDLFAYASHLKTRLLVRASWNRCVDHEHKHLWPYLEAQPLAKTLDMTVPVKKSKKTRTATIEVRFAEVKICAPGERRARDEPLHVYAVYVNEPHPTEGAEPLSWMLLTTIAVTTGDEALTVVGYYVVRWGIEVFHRILKSGCRIEERQLETAEGLRKCLALDSMVAWRIQFLTMVGRQTPDLPCDVVFEEHEWKALYCFVNKTTRAPDKPPSLNEAISLVARVGGFLGRKRDGQPGPVVLWRGLHELATICSAWFAFGPGRGETS